jgi:site-specific DNA-cytosine methylase
VLAQHRERLYFIAVRADLVHGRRLPSLALVQEGAHVSVSSGPGVETTGGSATSCSVKPAAQTSEGVTETNESTIFKFPWPELPNLNRTVGDILEPEETVPASLALDEHRWAKISGSSYYSKHPTARVADLGAKAQTIGSSYKRGWALYSQFVPVLSPTRSPATSTNGVGSSSSDDGSVVQGSRCGRQLPRFFTPREVARLQGFPESFVLDGLDPGRLYHQLGNAVRTWHLDAYFSHHIAIGSFATLRNDALCCHLVCCIELSRVLILLAWQVSPPIVAAVGASLIAWLEGKTDSESAAAGVTAALQFVENNL